MLKIYIHILLSCIYFLNEGPPGIVTPRRIAVKTVYTAKQTATKETHIDTITTHKKVISFQSLFYYSEMKIEYYYEMYKTLSQLSIC